METESFQPYIQAWKLRIARREKARKKRWQLARREAEALAKKLGKRYGADKVVLFGSVLDGNRFHEGSDIDLAVRGLRPERFFAAWSKLEEASPFRVDLVTLESCRTSLKARILTKGEVLYGG
ncbi:MAG: nucleotidyltransferase domain-containing protein [Candidatus Latescibacteria bacterium]|nr:nucleotidyltransferase domain-containing protein [Candidatus Latescibacterota bacterium]